MPSLNPSKMEIKMDMNDVKVYAMNTATMAISFAAIESTLKLVLLLVSIGYTATKWYDHRKNKKSEA